jgi:cell division protein FtsZ
MLGTGEATGERRAVHAPEAAIANPLIDDISMRGARALLISVTGGDDLTLFDLDEAASRIRQEVDDETNIILGATFEPSLEGVVRVSVVATGVDRVAVANTHVETEQLPVPSSHSQSPLSGAGFTRPTAHCWRD